MHFEYTTLKSLRVELVKCRKDFPVEGVSTLDGWSNFASRLVHWNTHMPLATCVRA